MTTSVDQGWYQTLKNLNIHLIDHTLHQFHQCSTPSDVVNWIVTSHNSNDAHKQTFDPLRLKKWDARENGGYALRIYYCRKVYTPGFGLMLNSIVDPSSLPQFESGVGGPFSVISYHYALFLYRKVKRAKVESTAKKSARCWEIFALTTGDAWNLVKSYSDFSFPVKVAMRCMSPKLDVVESKALAGHKGATTDTYKDPYALQDNELESLWKIFKLFKSHFKAGSSIYGLNIFADLREGHVIGAEIGRGKVLIRRELSINDYIELLSHLGKIARGESTVTISGANEEPDSSFRYLENIQPVSVSRGKELEGDLIAEIYRVYWGNEESALNMCFVHRYYRDFYKSNTYTINCKGHERTWNHPPLFSEVMDFLVLVSRFTHSVKSVDNLAQLIRTTSCQYDKGSYALIEFFDGELRSKIDGAIYFRNDGIWFHVLGDHLCTLQSAFHTHVCKSLMDERDPGHLPYPWIAADAWAAFTVSEGVQKKIPQKSLEQAITQLQGPAYKFTFVNPNGKALLPYATRCILQNISRKYHRLLKKNWEEINEILCNACTGKQTVDHQLFTKVLNEPAAKELMQALQCSYARCVEVDHGKQKKSASDLKILDGDGKVLITDLSQVTFPNCSATLEGCKTWLEGKLKKAQAKNAPLNKQTFITSLANQRVNGRKVGRQKAEFAYDALFKPVGITCSSKGDYLMQGPLPSDKAMTISMDAQVREFLNTKHNDYKGRCEEEGYNRLYTTKPGYIVCDQVYATPHEQVEMFDILYAVSGGKLYLYHVKEQFGQKTRDACAQIRAAAHNLNSDIASGNYPLLGALYDKAVKTEATTPFRRSLKQHLGQMSRDDFIDLFRKRKPQDIVFVYAFIDSAESKERLLKDERKPTHVFSAQELGAEALAVLKQLKYLDTEGRITSKFIRATGDQFKAALEKRVKGGASLYRRLHACVSKFDSMIAKIELIHAQRYVTAPDTGFKFGFQVCQIRRPSSAIESPLSFSAPTSQDKDGATTKIASDTILYEDVSYSLGSGCLEATAMLAAVIGLPLREDSATVKFHYDLALRSIESSRGSEIVGLLQSRLESKATKNYDTVVQAYVSEVVWKNCIGKDDMAIAAYALNKKVVFLCKHEGDEEEESWDISSTYNAEGLETVYFAEIADAYYLLSVSDDQLDENTLNNPLAGKYLDELVAQPLGDGVGIYNGGNTCFINACFQVLIHSPLFDFLIARDNVDTEEEGGEQVCNRLREFAAQYRYFEKINQALPALSSLRAPLNFSPTGQEDAGEVFSRILTKYHVQGSVLESRFTQKLQIDAHPEDAVDAQLSQKSVADLEKGYSQLDSSSMVPIPVDRAFQLNWPIPSQNDCALSACWDTFLNEPIVEDRTHKYRAKEGGRTVVKEGAVKVKRRQVEHLSNNLLVVLNRRDNSADGRKITSRISFPDNLSLNLSGSEYQITGLVIHTGRSLSSGHYTAYCCINGTWRFFDDSANPSTVTKEQVIEAARQAYIIHLSKPSAG